MGIEQFSDSGWWLSKEMKPLCFSVKDLENLKNQPIFMYEPQSCLMSFSTFKKFRQNHVPCPCCGSFREKHF